MNITVFNSRLAKGLAYTMKIKVSQCAQEEMPSIHIGMMMR